MDVARAYARWLWRRMAVLLPATAISLAVILFLCLREGLRLSLKVPALFVALHVNAVLGYFTIQTLLCARLQKVGCKAEARSLRRLLRPSGAAVASGTALLAVLTVIPELFNEEPRPVSPPGIARLEPLRPFERVARADAVALPAAITASAHPVLDVPARQERPSPQILAFIADLPRSLEEFERDLVVPVWPEGLEEHRRQEGPSREGAEEEREFPRLRLEELFARESEAGGEPMALERPGLPDEANPAALPPAEIGADALLLTLGHDLRGRGASLSLDSPTSPRGSLRMTFLGVSILDGEELFEGETALTGGRATLEYVYRLLGHTRHAFFDVSVGVGLSADSWSGHGTFDVDGDVRASPYVALDLAFWQAGPLGLLLHAGQSIPVNVAGGAACVTDLSATLRLDLSQHLSLHAGYRVLLLRLTDYDDPFASSSRHSSFDELLAGPLVGFELRF